MIRALLYAYVLGGITFIPLVIATFVFVTVYTSIPVGDVDMAKKKKRNLEAGQTTSEEPPEGDGEPPLDTNDTPRTRKGWLTMRRTFEESANDSTYVTLVRSFLDARSKDPKRSRPKDMWYVVLKGKVLYLYEDEGMSECEAAVELGGHEVIIFPEGLLDGELFAKRNAICLRPKPSHRGKYLPSVTKEMKLKKEDVDGKLDEAELAGSKREKEREKLMEAEKKKDVAREEALDPQTPWFIFVRSNVEMEDWYLALLHASEHPPQTPTLTPLHQIFDPSDMDHLVSTLDEQPDVIPMRWLNALLGRIFFSHYRTHNLEAYIIGRLMKKLSKVKRPTFLTDIVVTEVSVGNRAPMLSKPMLKELTKEGDASLEVHLQYKGEIRITVEATATINLGTFRSYTVKLVLAAVLKEIEGNLLIKVKRPPSNRLWYAFTQTPRIVLEVEPIVSDRQITWGMILSTIESKIKEIIQESVVMPNMDDIAFFESMAYERRGGIWSDASRHQRSDPQSSVSPECSGDTPLVSTTSAPDLISSKTSTSETLLPDVSQSVEELPMGNVVEVKAEPSMPSLNEENSTPSRTRRRSWFSVRNDDVESTLASASNADPSNAGEVEENRGREGQGDHIQVPQVEESASRSSSRSTRSVASLLPDEVQASLVQAHLSTHPARRSTSQHSTKQEQESDADSTSAARSESSPNTPRRRSDASQTTRPASPPSFFSTLKSRAADKQALQNTAKEAIRKWGVNWGGLKKDTISSGPNSDEPVDSGSTPPRLHPERSPSQAHKSRASYAEVRAAVAERKERERNGDALELTRSVSPSGTPDKPTSNPLALLPNGSIYSDNSVNPSIVTSTSRLSTTGLSSKKSLPSISRVTTDTDVQRLAALEEPQLSPIHVQPQAKMMTIPGIHVSHRGELQSMGYVAPQPPPLASSESKQKNPTMQSMYRLWKSPVLSGQEADVQEQPSQSLEQTGDSIQDKDVTPLALPPMLSMSPQSVRPTPPPLPPRATPTRPIIKKASTSPDQSPASPATEALKIIVSKDDARGQASLDQPPPESSGMSINKSQSNELGLDTTRPSENLAISTTSTKVPPPLPPRPVPT